MIYLYFHQRKKKTDYAILSHEFDETDFDSTGPDSILS